MAAGPTLYGEQGFAGVTTPAIATAAGLTRGALDRQLDNNAEIFAATCEEVARALVAGTGPTRTDHRARRADGEKLMTSPTS